MNSYYSAQYYGFKTLLTKEVRRFLRIWIQTLLPTPMTSFLYLLVFTAAFSGRVKEPGELAYSVFMSPGLILMAIMNNSFSNTVGSFFGAKFGKHIEEIIISPLDPLLMILGYVLGGALRGLLVGFFVFIISQLFAAYAVVQPLMIIMLAVGVAILFAQAGLLNAIFAQKFDDISLIPTFILTPLIYMGGVFYQVSKTQGWLYSITVCNPLYYLIQSFRSAMIGPVWPVLMPILGALAVANLSLFFVNYTLIKKRTGMPS